VKVIGVEGEEIRLPHHNWAIAKGHSLIVSGYVTYIPGAENYYDKCYLVIGSDLHNPASPVEHHYNLLDLFSFKPPIMTTPIMVLQTDGGVDVNSRNNMDRMCLGNFAWSKSVELLVHFTRAPGNSPLNPVERCFAPLTRSMANKIYPYDFYGNHLNSRKEIINPQLCLKNFEFQANLCASHLRGTNIHGSNPFVQVRTIPATLSFFGGEFSSSDYQLFLHSPSKVDEVKKTSIKKWETWLSNHSQSSWYCYQVRLCNCDLCPKNRPFEGLLEKMLPDLSKHKNFIPTPQKDPDSEHFLPLDVLLVSPYCRPDFFLPENQTSKFKPIFCKDCHTVCTSQKDHLKHRQIQHQNNSEKNAVSSNVEVEKGGGKPTKKKCFKKV